MVSRKTVGITAGIAILALGGYFLVNKDKADETPTIVRSGIGNPQGTASQPLAYGGGSPGGLSVNLGLAGLTYAGMGRKKGMVGKAAGVATTAWTVDAFEDIVAAGIRKFAPRLRQRQEAVRNSPQVI